MGFGDKRVAVDAHVAVLFGFDPDIPKPSFSEWERAIFTDDVPKLHAAVERASQTGAYYSEFRVRHPDGSVHWIAGKGEARRGGNGRAGWVSGVYYEISERKALEARLLALNETLEARITELREEARTLEVLNRTGTALAAELSLERLVQTVTDAAVELTKAQFGAFFYNVVDENGEAYTLYSLSGEPREAFGKFPMPRNTPVFEPTFRGEGSVRSDDILADPRYGQNPPFNGMPSGHLPVRSYLAIPVVSRSSEVIGGLFFGHPEPGVFTPRDERIVAGIAAPGGSASAGRSSRASPAVHRRRTTGGHERPPTRRRGDPPSAGHQNSVYDGVCPQRHRTSRAARSRRRGDLQTIHLLGSGRQAQKGVRELTRRSPAGAR
jgi:GAF domain-containing protein/PAS domain-containing protein